MDLKITRLGFALATGLVLQGCIAFPPLVQVTHKDSPTDHQELMKRLDALDHRLDSLEQKR